jgi:hypothetical protein
VRSGLACLALLAAGCATAKPSLRLGPEAMLGVKRIAVEIPQAGEFQTPVKRGQGTGAAVAQGGPIGAAIVEGMKARPQRVGDAVIATEIESPDCRGPLEDSFRDTLAASRHYQARIEHREFSDPQLVGFGALVRIEIEACGFRLLDQDRRILSAFVDLTFRVKTSHTRSEGWKSRQSFAGNTRSSLVELERNPELVRAEFQQVLAAAGRRLASELLYP